MNITLGELRVVVEKIFQHLEVKEKNNFEINEDYYWYIPTEKLYNPYSKPEQKDLTLGQLSQDVEAITDILEERKETIGYSLIWLATILRNIGENNVD